MYKNKKLIWNDRKVATHQKYVPDAGWEAKSGDREHYLITRMRSVLDNGRQSLDADGSKVRGQRPNTFESDGSKVGGRRPNTFDILSESRSTQNSYSQYLDKGADYRSQLVSDVFGLRPPTSNPSATMLRIPVSGSIEPDKIFHREYIKCEHLCNNCGKSGHLFHQCKIPIISIGIICYRICPENGTNEPDAAMRSTDADGSKVRGQRPNTFEYLIIRRKETLGYIDFMRGKYSVQNKDYIMNMLKQMTNVEKEQLKTKDFDHLWKNIWGNNNFQYKSEEITSREKFNTLVCGVKLYNDFYTIENLIDISQQYQNWEEPEWGFPKGRRNNQESDFECAIREFSEETGYSSDKLVYIQNVIPFEEIFTGSNYKSYKHKYFLMYMRYEDTLKMGKFQTSEVSKVEWKSFDDCIKYFRPYNLEKIRILQNVDIGLKNVSV